MFNWYLSNQSQKGRKARLTPGEFELTMPRENTAKHFVPVCKQFCQLCTLTRVIAGSIFGTGPATLRKSLSQSASTHPQISTNTYFSDLKMTGKVNLGRIWTQNIRMNEILSILPSMLTAVPAHHFSNNNNNG